MVSDRQMMEVIAASQHRLSNVVTDCVTQMCNDLLGQSMSGNSGAVIKRNFDAKALEVSAAVQEAFRNGVDSVVIPELQRVLLLEVSSTQRNMSEGQIMMNSSTPGVSDSMGTGQGSNMYDMQRFDPLGSFEIGRYASTSNAVDHGHDMLRDQYEQDLGGNLDIMASHDSIHDSLHLGMSSMDIMGSHGHIPMNGPQMSDFNMNMGLRSQSGNMESGDELSRLFCALEQHQHQQQLQHLQQRQQEIKMQMSQTQSQTRFGQNPHSPYASGIRPGTQSYLYGRQSMFNSDPHIQIPTGPPVDHVPLQRINSTGFSGLAGGVGSSSAGPAIVLHERFAKLSPAVQQQIINLVESNPVISIMDFDQKVLKKLSLLCASHGEMECSKLLVGMKNGAGYLDVAISNYLDVLQGIIQLLRKLPVESANHKLDEMGRKAFKNVENLKGCIASMLNTEIRRAYKPVVPSEEGASVAAPPLTFV
eukprot:gene32617-17634_t